MDAHVYELSSKGALVAYLRKRFPHLTCSEYFDDVAPGDFKGSTQCQDVQSLTYQDGAFELVTSTEVFEHVPDDARGFREIYRVLRPGGYFVLTVPLSGSDATVERAVIRDGQVLNLLPPEYHGDRIRGLGRVLAFRNYGTDICSRLEATGFAAEIRTITQPEYAIRDARVIVCRRR
jgi:SAM-dependent methyltransferase